MRRKCMIIASFSWCVGDNAAIYYHILIFILRRCHILRRWLLLLRIESMIFDTRYLAVSMHNYYRVDSFLIITFLRYRDILCSTKSCLGVLYLEWEWWRSILIGERRRGTQKWAAKYGRGTLCFLIWASTKRCRYAIMASAAGKGVMLISRYR